MSPLLRRALRLTFVFARNAGAPLPILRQGGDDQAESAVLDVEMK